MKWWFSKESVEEFKQKEQKLKDEVTELFKRVDEFKEKELIVIDNQKFIKQNGGKIGRAHV